MVATLQCPHCLGPSQWEENPYRPFCCERCRLLDLGRWMKGDYRIAGEPAQLSDEEAAVLEKESEDSTLH